MQEETMATTLTKNWWALALRGLAAVLFGLATFAWPALTLSALVLLYGAYALTDGLFTLVAAARAVGGGGRRLALVFQGALGIAAGLVALFWPGLTALALLWTIAAWSILTGLLEIAAAVRLRREIEGEWLLGLGGIASVLFGALLLARPGSGALAVTWLIGAYAISAGFLLLMLSFRLRGRRQREAPLAI
jgi:uncharacterized membrane protein HdeD (DUF308 family)